jgi:hypothetical protein
LLACQGGSWRAAGTAAAPRAAGDERNEFRSTREPALRSCVERNSFRSPHRQRSGRHVQTRPPLVEPIITTHQLCLAPVQPGYGSSCPSWASVHRIPSLAPRASRNQGSTAWQDSAKLTPGPCGVALVAAPRGAKADNDRSSARTRDRALHPADRWLWKGALELGFHKPFSKNGLRCHELRCETNPSTAAKRTRALL